MLFLECSPFGVVVGFQWFVFFVWISNAKKEKHFANEFDIIHSNGDVALHFLSPINWEWNIFMLLGGGGSSSSSNSAEVDEAQKKKKKTKKR